MCNCARNRAEPEAVTWFGDGLMTERPRDNRFNPVELVPRGRAYVVCEENGRRGVDVMSWDVLGGNAPWPMTNVRNLALSQWRRLAENPANRCLIRSPSSATGPPTGTTSAAAVGDFHDVTQGDNKIGDIGYTAAPGWDPCTGLGSPNGAALMSSLNGTGG